MPADACAAYLPACHELQNRHGVTYGPGFRVVRALALMALYSTAEAEPLDRHLLPMPTDPGAELRGQP